MIQDVSTNQKISEQEAEKIVTQYIDECTKRKEALKSSNIQIEPDKNDDEGNAPLAKSVGSYPYRNGVILVTDDGSTGHAGIIWTPSTTIESMTEGGVQRCFNEWDKRYDITYGVISVASNDDYIFTTHSPASESVLTKYSKKDRSIVNKINLSGFVSHIKVFNDKIYAFSD